MDKYILRRAKLEDYPEVKKMSGRNIYFGLDYIDRVFEYWIACNSEDTSSRHCLVLVHKESDQIAGYQSLMFQHEGRFALIQALRIDPLQQGQGLGKLFEAKVNQYLRDLMPQVKVMKSVYRPYLPEVAVRRMLQEGKLITRRCMLWIPFEPNEMVNDFRVKFQKEAEIVEIEDEKFYSMVKRDAGVRSICLENDFLCLEFLAIRYSDVEKIPQYNKTYSFFVDNLDNPKSISAISVPFLSAGNIYRMYIDFFASNLDSLKPHLAHHLSKVMAYNDKNPLVIFFTANVNLSKDFTELLLGELQQKEFVAFDEKTPRESLTVLLDLKGTKSH